MVAPEPSTSSSPCRQERTCGAAGQLWSPCLTTPRSYMAAASAFHLFDLPAGAKAADGLYETEVVEAQEAE